MSGWIKLHRKILESQVWTSEPFSRGQAWVDLLLLANHEYGFFYLRDHKIEVQRGQVGWSHLKLSQRWKWSRTKVKRFIKDLEKEQQVIQQQSHSTSIITILNYDEYQEKVQQEDNRNATGMQQKDTNKKNKEETKKNKEVPAFEDFLSYALENKPDVNHESVKLKYKAWKENGWKDGKGQPVKNWKSKLLNTLPHLQSQEKPKRGYQNDFNL